MEIKKNGGCQGMKEERNRGFKKFSFSFSSFGDLLHNNMDIINTSELYNS